MEALIGKSADYVMGFNEGYKDKAKMNNLLYASGGCCLGAAAGFGAFYLIVSSAK